MPISIYDPRILDGIVKIMPANGGFFRDMFFKRRVPVPGIKIDVDFYKGKRRIAPFVNPKSAAKVMEKTGFKTNTFVTPLLKPKDVTTIEDLSVRLPGESIYSGYSRDERALTLLTEKLAEFNDSMIRREEWMCSQAMLTGKIPVIGEGVNYTIDFGFTNKETLLGASLWSSATSDPLADIDRWVLACQQSGYHTPNVCLMSADTHAAFVKRLMAQGVMNQFSGNVELATIKPSQLSENVIYGGMILKYNMPIYIYNEWYIDDWTNPDVPVENALVPNGTCLLGSTNAKSAIYYGELTLADETSNTGFRSTLADKIADTWIEKDPAARYLAMHSRPLTTPQEVDSWYVASVL